MHLIMFVYQRTEKVEVEKHVLYTPKLQMYFTNEVTLSRLKVRKKV